MTRKHWLLGSLGAGVAAILAILAASLNPRVLLPLDIITFTTGVEEFLVMRRSGGGDYRPIHDHAGYIGLTDTSVTGEWRTFRGHSYRLTTAPAQWKDAAEEARRLGGYLVTVSDSVEADWLATAFAGAYYWIGFHDSENEGAWRWQNGERATYTRWAGGEPNNMYGGDGEDYALMNWSTGGSWNDSGERSPESVNGHFGIIEVERHVDQEPWFWKAPARVLTLLAGSGAKVLYFERRDGGTRPRACRGTDVVLVGATGTLSREASPIGSVTTEWTRYSVELDGASAPAGRLQALQICAGERSVDSTIALDNVGVLTDGRAFAQIIPEGGAGHGRRRVRLLYGSEGAAVGPEPAKLERTLELVPELALLNGQVHLRVAGTLETIADRPPAGPVYAALWRMGADDEDEVEDLVTAVRLVIDGVTQTPSATDDMGQIYPLTEQYETARLHTEVDLEFLGANATVEIPLDDSDSRALRLGNPVARGYGFQPVAPVPDSPLSSDVFEGRYLVHLPARWLDAPSHTLDIFLDERQPDGSWRQVDARPAFARRDRQGPSMRFDLDDAFGILERRGPAYRARFVVNAPDAPAPVHQFSTPVMTRDDITSALQSRVEDISRRLLGITFHDWRAERNADAAAAKRRLWKTLAQSHLFNVRVDVTNLYEGPGEFRRDVVVTGVFTDGQRELSRTPIRLGTYEVGDVQNVPALRTATITIPPFSLGGGRSETQKVLGRLQGFEIRADPMTSDPDAIERVFVRLGPYPGNDDPCVLLADAVVRHTPDVVRAGDALAKYEAAVKAVFSAEGIGEGAATEYQKCRDLLEALYAELERKAAMLEERLQDEGTGLGALEVCINRLMAQGYTVQVGRRLGNQPGITTIGAYAGYTKQCEFELTNTFWRRGWSALGTALNPELSHTLNPGSPLLLGDDTATSATPPVSPVTLPGVHRWRLSEMIADDEERALRRVFNNPVLSDALSRYIEAEGTLSPDLQNLIRLRELEQVKGQLHEELGWIEARTERLEALRRANPQYASRIVFVPGRYISAPGLAAGEGNLKFTDGMFVANINGRIHVFGIEEYKSGTGSAQGAGNQAVRDLLRMTAFGFSFNNLPRELQNGLRLGNSSVEIPANRFVVNFENNTLFHFRMPRDSRVPVLLSTTEVKELNDLGRRHGVQVTEAQIRAIESSLRATRRTEYTQWELEDLAMVLARQVGTRLLPWDARDVSRDQLAVMLRARRPGISDEEIDRAFAEGLRIREVGGPLEPVFEKWERPVQSREEYEKLYRELFKERRGRDPRPKEIQEELARYDAGTRRHPVTWRHQNPGARGTRLFTVDGSIPLEFLSHREFMIWYHRSNTAARYPYGEEEIKARRANGQVLDMATGQWRSATKDDFGTETWRMKPADRGYADWHRRQMELRRRAVRARAGRETAAQLAAAAARGLLEYGKLKNERLRAVVLTANKTAIVEVTLFTAEGQYPLTLEQEYRVLEYWYRNARHVWGQGELPRWLRAAGRYR